MVPQWLSEELAVESTLKHCDNIYNAEFTRIGSAYWYTSLGVNNPFHAYTINLGGGTTPVITNPLYEGSHYWFGGGDTLGKVRFMVGRSTSKSISLP